MNHTVVQRLLVLAVAVWARLAVFPAVLLPSGVSPANGDSEYHLRRMLLAWETFPALSSFDPLLGWPAGHAHHWAPGFDWVAALLLRLTFQSDPTRLALLAALYPVLLGALTVWAVMTLTERLLPPSAPAGLAAVAGLVSALVPQFVATSRLARTDHHVWEAMSMVALLLWALDGLGPRPRRATAFELFGAAVVTATLAGFVGGPLYLALILPVVLLGPLTAPRVRWWGSGATALLVGGALDALINLGPVGEHGQRFAFGYPTFLQPALSLGAGVLVTLAVLISRRTAAPGRRLAALLAVVLGLGLGLLVVPGVGPEVRAALSGWLLKRDPWLAGISEFQPLFSVGRGAVGSVTFYLGLVSLFAPALAAVALFHQRTRRDVVGFSLVFAALVALTLLQMRFGRVLAPLLGVAFVLGALAVVERLGSGRAAATVVGLALALSALDPEVRRELVLADDRAPSPVEELADALRLTRPPVPGLGDGVLCSWELGHTVLSRAHRPVIASGFGSYTDPEAFRQSSRAFQGTEGQLLEVLARYDLGVVITGASTQLKEPGGAPLTARSEAGLVWSARGLTERPLGVLLQGGSGIPGVAPHAEHLMPIAASSTLISGFAQPTPGLWAYARVRGARLTAPCRPGVPLVAHLDARVAGQPFRFVAWAPCPASGEAELHLSVPTDLRAPNVVTDHVWQIETALGDRLIQLAEGEVR